MALKGGDFDPKPVGTGMNTSRFVESVPKKEGGFRPIIKICIFISLSSALPAFPADARTPSSSAVPPLRQPTGRSGLPASIAISLWSHLPSARNNSQDNGQEPINSGQCSVAPGQDGEDLDEQSQTARHNQLGRNGFSETKVDDISMRKIREMMPLHFGAGLIIRQVARSCNVGHSTVVEYALCTPIASNFAKSTGLTTLQSCSSF